MFKIKIRPALCRGVFCHTADVPDDVVVKISVKSEHL